MHQSLPVTSPPSATYFPFEEAKGEERQGSEAKEDKREEEGEDERDEMLRFYNAQRLELLQENDDVQVFPSHPDSLDFIFFISSYFNLY